MPDIQYGITLRGLTESLEARAVAIEGVPTELAGHARHVTDRNMAHIGSGPLASWECERVRRYFAGVLRRASARAGTPGAREYRRRLIAASLAADLRAAGIDGPRVQAEVDAALCGASE